MVSCTVCLPGELPEIHRRDEKQERKDYLCTPPPTLETFSKKSTRRLVPADLLKKTSGKIIFSKMMGDVGMSHHEKEGEQEDAYIYRDRRSLITPSLHLCLCVMQLFCCWWVLGVQFEDK